VLVCGESLRGDDGAALAAVEMLPADVRSLVEIVEIGQLSVEALVDVPQGVSVIVADAALGVAAGAVVVLPLQPTEWRAISAGPVSSHALPPAQVLELAREMRGELPSGVFVGIGGRQFELGMEMSPEVEAALPRLIDALSSEIRALVR
jgi:hydrogenase maturation protease